MLQALIINSLGVLVMNGIPSGYVSAMLAPSAIVEAKSMTGTIPEIVLKALRYTCYGDTIGQGVEMWPRSRILENWEALKQGLVWDRRPPYDVGLAKGRYTDDTEMSIGVIRAIQKEHLPSPDAFAQSFFEVYDSFRNENGGIPRGGYGQIKKIASLTDQNRLAALKASRDLGEFRNGAPGNGSCMRVLPVLLLSDDPQIIFKNIISQTLATHNHACAVLANLVYIDVANAFMKQLIRCEDIIHYALDLFQDDRKWHHLFPSLSLCKKDLLELSAKAGIPLFGNFDVLQQTFIHRLKVLNSIDGPIDAKGSNLEGVISVIMKPNAVQADETLFGTLYCWKWTQLDLENNGQSHFSLIMRCLSFGGDVDTLLACVIPVSFIHLENRGEQIKLPEWVAIECEESAMLEKRLVL